MLLRLADFNIEVKNKFDYISRLAEDYIYEGSAQPDVTLSVSQKELQFERSLAGAKNFSDGYLESIAILRKLAEWLPHNDTLFLHSAVFEVEGKGVAFAALSGTGKTTHMRLWQQLLGDKLTVINGDKPFVRFFNENGIDTPYAYGTPWNGKERYGINSRTLLKNICLIERAENNSCEITESDEAINKFFLQMYMSHNSDTAVKTLELANRLTKSCTFWRIRCNTDLSAAETAYKAIFSK